MDNKQQSRHAFFLIYLLHQTPIHHFHFIRPFFLKKLVLLIIPQKLG